MIVYGKEEANRLSNSSIEPTHLLLGMFRSGESVVTRLLSEQRINIWELKRQIEERLKERSDVTLPVDADVRLTPQSTKILKLCVLEARLLKSDVANPEHVLLAILKENSSVAAELLQQHEVTYESVYEWLSLQLNNVKSTDVHSGLGGFSEEEEDEDDTQYSSPSDSSASVNDKKTAAATATKRPDNDTPALDNFGMDMTKAAEEGKLDPIVGREKEIERLAQILSRRKKNNPILVGEAGVGKSAIVEGLALRIVEKKVSRVLFDKRVISLDMASVVAGTKYRGQFEERIRSILKELQKNPQIILFIDEIHTIVGAGSATGSMDAANMLKPALARGEIQCIGATTLDEYRKSIEKDAALERRFQKVLVEATTPEETLQILQNIKDKYEDHHNVTYTNEALEACVNLTGRYISDRSFPDKAIDALDESGSRVHITNVSVPKEIEEQEYRIEKAREAKNKAVKDQDYELAANCRDTEKELQEELGRMKQRWEAGLKMNREKVDEEQIAQVVSMMSGIPVQRMAQAEGNKLSRMKEDLQGKIIAQDKAIEKLTKAILRNRVGLKDPNKPIGTFMFLGPTGVGKTYLAQELAQFMFGSKDALIRIDMSEYMEKFTVSRLVGAPPGYVGYEEGGLLSEKVRRKPYSIVLLDEIEKAHPDVFNILLQVMDEGRLTDSYGRLIDFKNTVLIMTSNVGSRQLKEFGRGIGFTSPTLTDDREYTQSVIQKALNKSFAPEFLNRIDEVITFDQLSLDAIVKIIDLELDKMIHRVQQIGYGLQIDEEAKNFLARKGYDVQYGARPLKRSIQTYLEDALAELIVSGDVSDGSIIHVSLNEQKDGLKMTPQE